MIFDFLCQDSQMVISFVAIEPDRYSERPERKVHTSASHC